MCVCVDLIMLKHIHNWMFSSIHAKHHCPLPRSSLLPSLGNSKTAHGTHKLIQHEPRNRFANENHKFTIKL